MEKREPKPNDTIGPNLNPDVTALAAKPISRQRRWQLKMRQSGRCIICGRVALPDSDKCLPHLRKARAAMRKKLGRLPWRPGGLGRVPRECKGKQFVRIRGQLIEVKP